jgi:hypothetical protein
MRKSWLKFEQATSTIQGRRVIVQLLSVTRWVGCMALNVTEKLNIAIGRMEEQKKERKKERNEE